MCVELAPESMIVLSLPSESLSGSSVLLHCRQFRIAVMCEVFLIAMKRLYNARYCWWKVNRELWFDVENVVCPVQITWV